jgi:hypothetical protein
LNTPQRGNDRLCPDARALLPGYVEDELSPIEIRLVQGHLDICSACRREEIAYRSSLGALRVAPKPTHGDLYAGLSAKLDRLESRRQPFRPRQLRWAGALAVLVLTVGVGATVATKAFFSPKVADPPVITNLQPTDVPVHVAGAPHKPSDQKVAARTQDLGMDGPDASNGEVTSDNGNSDDEPKYYPEDPSRERAQKPRQRSRKPNVENWASSDINKVVDSRGRSVESIINELKKNNRLVMDKTQIEPVNSESNHTAALGTGDDTQIKPVPVDDPSMPDVAMIVPEKEKREAVGEKIVKSSRAEGYTKSGRLALIHLTAEAAPKPGIKRQLRKDFLDDDR